VDQAVAHGDRRARADRVLEDDPVIAVLVGAVVVGLLALDAREVAVDRGLAEDRRLDLTTDRAGAILAVAQDRLKRRVVGNADVDLGALERLARCLDKPRA
jgi:hypothetical protein